MHILPPSSPMVYNISTFTASFWVSHWFLFFFYFFSPPTVVMISQVVTGMIVRCICKCGWVWAPRAVCLWIHLSTLYQILLHRRLVSALPQHFTSSFEYKGVRDKGERFEVFQTRPRHPTTLTTTQQLTHAYSKTGPAQLPHPSPPLSPTVSPLTSSHSFFCFCFILIFFDNAILKALCLVIPLCEHVNDNLLQKC